MPHATVSVETDSPRRLGLGRAALIGVLPGEGASPEVVEASLAVLRAADEKLGLGLRFERGGRIGTQSYADCGRYLSDEVATFCSDIFSRGGAILAGAAGGRFVYDTRKRFDLYYKINPIRSFPELKGSRRLVLDREVDLLVVRENKSGLYHGEDAVHRDEKGGRVVRRTFECVESDVRRLLRVAAGRARSRTGRLAVVCKQAALGAVDEVWREVAAEEAGAAGVSLTCLDIDLAAYRVVQEPETFDVIATANCFGDVLADLGGVICGGRGTTYGASFSDYGSGVFQTNHGAAYDLAGTDKVNPAGQILSAGLLLAEHLGRSDGFDLIEGAVRRVWGEGWRTADLRGHEGRVLGAQAFAERVVAAVTETRL
jgi:3-isopropylmalate dehydrogenase